MSDFKPLIIVRPNPKRPREWLVEEGALDGIRYTCQDHAEFYARWRASMYTDCEVHVITPGERRVVSTDELPIGPQDRPLRG